MIEVDGSYGEGGGAVLRIATALSAVTSEPVLIKNIRSGRNRPGLMPQHLNAVKAVRDLTNASVSGMKLGSTELFFNPETIKGGNFNIDVGTAGSITLILQAFMIPAAFADETVKITITGGTDVRWSPSVDYFKNVTLPILKLMGYRTRIQIIQRGHYPRGGGILEIEIDPVKKIKPLNILDLEFEGVNGVSHAVKLPKHVALRQAMSAESTLIKEGYNAKIDIQKSDRSAGPGSGISIWTNGRTGVGATSIGEPGKPAEEVGCAAAKELLCHISSGAALDRYMGDQIIPYMALAGNSSVKTGHLTQHALTNICVTEKFIQKKFHLDGGLGESTVIHVD